MLQPLILLSGLLSDETIWNDVAQRVGAFAAVTIMAFPNMDSIEAMAELVIEKAPPEFSLAGHSMGGRVALEVVRRAPHRVRRLGLFNTGIHPRRDSEFESRGRLVDLAREKGMTALAAEWLPPMMGASAQRQAEVMPRLIRMVERATPQSFAAQTQALLNRPDGGTALSAIHVPTLLASGTADTWSPIKQHEEMRQRIAGATLVEIDGAGHMAPVEQPDAVAAAITVWMRV
jgi:pimeloyl-ACP methyl ester carboxylesterase